MATVADILCRHSKRVKMIGWRLLVLWVAIVVPASSTTTDYGEGDNRPSDGPKIYPTQSEVVLQKGQNYTFFCSGKRELTFKQQEVPEEAYQTSFQTNMTVEMTSHDPESHYKVALHLYNVDDYAIGYYACFDDTVTDTEFLSDIKEEPRNTPHISYIYVYVNGTESLLAPMKEVVIATVDSDVVIGCRPTTPDVQVTLNTSKKQTYSPKIGFLVRARIPPPNTKCEARRGNDTTDKTIHLLVHQLPEPKVSVTQPYFLDGDTFVLNCTVVYVPNTALMLTWTYPEKAEKTIITSDTNERVVTAAGGTLYNNLTVTHAARESAGNYTCVTDNGHERKSATVVKKFLEKGFITMKKGRSDPILENPEGKMMRFHFNMKSYPPAKYDFLKDNEVITKNPRYKVDVIQRTGTYILTLNGLMVNDTGNYTLSASNDYEEKSVTYNFRVQARPVIKNFGEETKFYVKGTSASLMCEATGYPLPSVMWSFVTDEGDSQETPGTDYMRSLYEMQSVLKINRVQSSGNITCIAKNKMGEDERTNRFLVYEIPGGFGILNKKNEWYPESQLVVKICLASIYDYEYVTWIRDDGKDLSNYINNSSNDLSLVSKLKFDRVSAYDAGNYSCVAVRYDGQNQTDTISISVKELRGIEFIEPSTDNYTDVYLYQPVRLSCLADAVPRPDIQWFKDGLQLTDYRDVKVVLSSLNDTTLNSTVIIGQMHEEDKGKYECVAFNDLERHSRFFNLSITEKTTLKAAYVAIIGAIFFLLLLLVLYLVWKIKKEKKLRKELAAAGLLYFNEGVAGSINPELGIDEQAELLPYDNKFEFPAEKLVLGKQLGAGAFGVVYKADARGIVDAEETTTVAVKMVKKTADNMYIKALASELKIMVHLGKHVNIVNLLGACTKNVGKRELIVIVEYCKFGCIHTYLQRHREVFIDQLTESKEKGFGRVNRGFSSSSANSGTHSDYFGYSNQSQGTDNTFVNTANTNRSGRKENPKHPADSEKASETGYVQPEWRSNYESDYSEGRSPRPLCSRDLLCWAFQIARGMDYLASRKVLHGDLAARNILLAEDNVVKICDFGLARSIYKNDEYQKKENSPVPIKWLAIECMMDRIFSTQSDVWSFGVVLWELFSLAKTPYPNISLQGILPWLVAGNRLGKPAYADERLYSVMLRCWDAKPPARPSFAELQETLGSFLEDNVRNHYIDLNSHYNDINSAKRAEGVEDYLAMVVAPDYNNMVTPSPHHYVNEANSFFPPTPAAAVQLQHDDEGYLQMSPATNPPVFSPRAQDTKFDFDARKLNPRVHNDHAHCELTPMLTLNNLPARGGSESDQDGSTSPYLKMCPRIDEEADEVFEKQNNAKNIAVSNPTYLGINFDQDIEKKPVQYVNTSAHNGLVI
ncbi:vascular endothelial growth factor receptor 1 isoform X3 [Plutella xylostella]|uniref:vascular endothelial growth factor receptor 1 isoform X3 n=1 Tax=Plutella xylostella TaxID=51655 RepID=UPI002032FA56|nr:vascular endothelial growth factor receptor 1 isoform X3 [Plutella xylostella]